MATSAPKKLTSASSRPSPAGHDVSPTRSDDHPHSVRCARVNPNTCPLASDTRPPTSDLRPLTSSTRGVRLTAWLLCLLLVTLSGCGGCRQGGNSKTAAQREAEAKKRREELKKKQQEKKKPDFEVQRVRVQPHMTDKDSAGLGRIKPGHWVSVNQQIKTNNFDFHGEMDIGVVDDKNRPIYLDRTPFRLMTSRPASLPKGQTKFMEMAIFVPPTARQTRLSTTLRGAGGAALPPQQDFFGTMPSYQYYIVVLARQSSRYGFLNALDSVKAPYSDSSDELTRFAPHYLVIPMDPSRRTPLPSHAMAWTSIAYLVWDDVSPDSLTPEQQTALVDWLHWGGQLIVSGPNSLEALQGGFLADYLPATAGKARKITADDVRPISDYWTRPGKNGRPAPPLAVTDDWSGVSLQLAPEHESHAQFIPKTGDLLVEGAVGRGRIVVTAMRLNERNLINWSGVDDFFNGCLLRRPARTFRESADLAAAVSWADMPLRDRDARLTTNLNYFSRDIGVNTNFVRTLEDPYGRYGGMTGTYDPEEPDQIEVWTEPTQRGGVAAWNDFSETATVAREALIEAAGIEVPKSSFVVMVLAVYLIVIVPVNWFVFTLIGRIEWAWIAAPVIALLCAAAVIRLAQLDIGFARAQTEIAVLEMHEDYPRAHLSRYTALYTSLSTTYDLTFDDMSAVAQPLAEPDFQLVTGQSRSTITYFRHTDVQLRGLRVASNTTDMVHSEQMSQLSGGFVLEAPGGLPLKLTNNTGFDVTDVCLVRRGRDPDLDRPYLAAGWIGDLPTGATVSCALDERVEITDQMQNAVAAEATPPPPRSPRQPPDGRFPPGVPATQELATNETATPDSNPAALARADLPLNRFLSQKRAASPAGQDKLNLRRLFDLAQDPRYFTEGEIRLVGRVDRPLPGMAVRPSAKQVRSATLVIAHLVADMPGVPERDTNSRLGFGAIKPDPYDE